MAPPAYATATLLQRNGLTLQDFDLYEIHEAFAATVVTILKAWESPRVLPDPPRAVRAAGIDRPDQTERQRFLPGDRPSLRRHRGPDSRRDGQGTARPGADVAP